VLALGSGHSPQEVRQLLNVHGEPVDFWGYSFVSGPIERQRLLSGKPLERILPLNFLANWSSGVAHAMQRAFTVFLVDYDEHTGSPVTHPDEGNPFLTPVPTHPLSSESPPPAGYTAPCRLIREHCIQRGQEGGDWDDPCLLCDRKLASRLFAEIRADQSRLPSAVMGTSALDDSLFASLHHVCWAGFVDMACPIMVTDVIVGVAFTGQLLVEGLGLDTEGKRARDRILSDLGISLADFSAAASEVAHVQLSDAKQDAWLWLRKATVELQEIARARYGQIGTVRTQVLCDGLCTQIRATELKPRTIDSVRRELITPCLQDISSFFSFSRAAAFAPSGGTWSIVASWPQTGRALPLPVPLKLLDKLRNPLDTGTLVGMIDPEGILRNDIPAEGNTSEAPGIGGTKIRQLSVQLDTNGDGVITTGEGISSYLPGYAPYPLDGFAQKPVLSAGTSFSSPGYCPQEIRILLPDVGTAPGKIRIDKIQFTIIGVSEYGVSVYDGTDRKNQIALRSRQRTFCENAAGNGFFSHDFYFGDVHLKDSTSIQQGELLPDSDGAIEPQRAWLRLFCQDYGGSCLVTVWPYVRGRLVRALTIQIPLDSDHDGMADVWEKQFTQKVESLSPEADDEPLSPHHSNGDGLKVAQEYRGFILDGGGYDGNGNGGHPGGHTRLRPDMKELLVELDIMGQVPDMPAPADRKTIMESTCRGFSDSTDGAQCQAYYVLDDVNLPHVFLESDEHIRRFFQTSQNALLKEGFVHVLWGGNTCYEHAAHSGLYGCYLDMPRCKGRYDTHINNLGWIGTFNDELANTVAHELTHTLLHMSSKPPFDDGEHLHDPNTADGPDGPLDQKYIMYQYTTEENFDTIVFSSLTLEYLSFRFKDPE